MKIRNRPPAGAPYVWLTRELLASDAWRSLGINARRFVDFLMIEHMNKAGQHNGKLKAPYRELRKFRIDARYVAGAIREAEELGLVDCLRGGRRVATRYALTWFVSHDGTPASNRWRTYHNPNLPPLTVAKCKNLPDKGKAGLPDKGKADGPNLPDKGKADDPKNLPDKGKALLRESLTTVGAVFSEGEEPCRLSSRSASPPCGGGLLCDCIEHGMILDAADLDAAAGDPSAYLRLHPYRRPSRPEGSQICIGSTSRSRPRTSPSPTRPSPQDRRPSNRWCTRSISVQEVHMTESKKAKPKKGNPTWPTGKPRPLSAIDGKARKAVGLVYLRQFDEIGEMQGQIAARAAMWTKQISPPASQARIGIPCQRQAAKRHVAPPRSDYRNGATHQATHKLRRRA
jgi:hypothetical protein